MRKRIVRHAATPATTEEWLDLEKIASVEVTSEDDAFPIEAALSLKGTQGWRAAEPGAQTIRLIFDQPQSIKQLSLLFVEKETQRTQEFTVRSSSDRGKSFQEIVRQQWNFSSPDATRETENYTVDLSRVTMLDLTIDPDREHRTAKASLLSLRVA
jgi:XRCC1 N terminal domain